MSVTEAQAGFSDLGARYEQVVLHGRALAYREIPGAGPVVLLIHGVGGSGENWSEITQLLADRGVHVVVADLPGHGKSAKDRGDYSLGAMASALRDLLDHLGHQRAVLVGHSLGGGIAMQFVYQFPARVEGLVLVASGGLGDETMPWLRAATLPGAEVVFSLISSRAAISSASWAGRQLARFGAHPPALSQRALARIAEFADPGTRRAFLATLRSVVDVSGQRVSALDKLPVAAHLPVLLIWGECDPTIPLRHGRDAAELLPGGRLVVFPGAGHEPHVADPHRFAGLLVDYLIGDVAASSADPAALGDYPSPSSTMPTRLGRSD